MSIKTRVMSLESKLRKPSAARCSTVSSVKSADRLLLSVVPEVSTLRIIGV